jgi:hypothetical protein
MPALVSRPALAASSVPSVSRGSIVGVPAIEEVVAGRGQNGRDADIAECPLLADMLAAKPQIAKFMCKRIVSGCRSRQRGLLLLA